jgi:hypothetical protein
MDDVSPSVTASINEAIKDRGWIINSFAQVEFLLGDLIVRSRRYPEYEELTTAMPWSLDGRIARLRSMCAVQGPLSRYAPELLRALAAIEEAKDQRHLLAHGFCIALIGTPGGRVVLQFRRFNPKMGDPSNIDVELISPEEMHQRRLRWSHFAGEVVHFFSIIYDELGLEHVLEP